MELHKSKIIIEMRERRTIEMDIMKCKVFNSKSFTSSQFRDVLHKSYPRYLFDEVAKFCYALIMFSGVMMSDVIVVIAHTYRKLIRQYEWDYFDTWYNLLTTSHYNISTLKKYHKVIPYLKDNFGVDLKVNPLLYIYKLTRAMHKLIVDKLQTNHERLDTSNGLSFKMKWPIRISINNSYCTLQKVVVKNNSITMQIKDCEMPCFATIDAIMHYMVLIDALSL